MQYNCEEGRVWTYRLRQRGEGPALTRFRVGLDADKEHGRPAGRPCRTQGDLGRVLLVYCRAVDYTAASGG